MILNRGEGRFSQMILNMKTRLSRTLSDKADVNVAWSRADRCVRPLRAVGLRKGAAAADARSDRPRAYRLRLCRIGRGEGR